MTSRSQSCKSCGKTMRVVTAIPPVVAQHGLVAFLCPHCGNTHCVLIEASGWDSYWADTLRETHRDGERHE
jgi:predicted RNA-binding Zn-ribbon protein involved in translation (DUF1610 family)